MSDTPETDAQPIKFVRETKFNGLEEEMIAYVPKSAMARMERARKDLMRAAADCALENMRLESERNEANQKLGDMIEEVATQMVKRTKTQRERDQWRECAEKLADILSVGGTIRALEQDGRIALAEFYRLKGEAK